MKSARIEHFRFLILILCLHNTLPFSEAFTFMISFESLSGLFNSLFIKSRHLSGNFFIPLVTEKYTLIVTINNSMFYYCAGWNIDYWVKRLKNLKTAYNTNLELLSTNLYLCSAGFPAHKRCPFSNSFVPAHPETVQAEYK